MGAVLARIADRWGHSERKSFHNVASRRYGCTMPAALEVKKEILIYVTKTEVQDVVSVGRASA